MRVIDDSSIAQWFKGVRKKQGHTLRDVFDATGLSIGHLSDFERGQSQMTLSRLNTLASFYGYSIILTKEDVDTANEVYEQGYKDGIKDALNAIQELSNRTRA